MTKIKIAKYNYAGEQNGYTQINTKFADLKFNHDLIKQVVDALRSNSRQVLSNTKTRAEVSGTNKKPYKQKGTGNARVGSMRTPVHIGGGIAFGPRKEQNFKKQINKSAKRKALAICLNEKNNQKELISIEKLDIKNIKTKDALTKIAKLPVKEGTLLILTAQHDKNTYLAFRNVPYIDIKFCKDLNCIDLFTYDTILLEESAETILSDILSDSKTEVKKEETGK